jgi:hypothetical protein
LHALFPAISFAHNQSLRHGHTSSQESLFELSISAS